MAWVLRFVDSTEAGRSTRLDLHVTTGANGTIQMNDLDTDAQPDFGTAALERTLADVEGRDGAVVTSAKRPMREVRLPLLINGTSVDFATQMGKIARECDRAKNFLEWWPDGVAAPVFFVVRGGDIETPDIQDNQALVWRCELMLLCDPYALGSKVTITQTALPNDPATGQQFSLPPIKGDIEAPLNVEAGGTNLTGDGATALLNVHTNPVTSARIMQQAESATMSTDTTVQANAGVMSGSGSNYVRTTFAVQPAIETRFTFSGLFAKFGTYKMLVRVRKSTAGDTFDVRRSLQAPGGTVFKGPTRRYSATPSIGPHWLDLGVISLPAGAAPPGVTSGTVGHLSVEAGRVTGAGNLDFDVVVLVPTDMPDAPEPNTSIVWHQWGSSLFVVGWNSEDEEVYTYASGSYGHAPARPIGTFPKVYPGYDNHLVFMRHVDLRPGGPDELNIPVDTRGWTTDLTCWYQPRYLFVASP